MAARTRSASAAESAAAALSAGFFGRPAHEVAPELIGCTLLHDGVGGTIVEAEAYEEHEPACHAYRGLSRANRALFGPPAHAYVYLSYGIHSCFNLVTGEEGRGEAVLIRALEPRFGIERMAEQRGIDELVRLCSGPGRLTAALGIGLESDGMPALEPPFAVLEPSGERAAVVPAPRIGITKATELSWRFCAADSPFLSRPLPPRSGVGSRPP